MIAFADPVPDATEIAEMLTGRTYLSWSAISTFLRCPLKYQFHYCDQLPEEFVSSNLIFGGAIHSALEVFFRELLTARRPLNIDALMAVYHEAWIQANLAEVQFGKNENRTSLAQLAERMFQAFLNSALSRPVGSIIGIEEEFQAPLIADCPDLFARLDLMLESDDALTITDFKTARTRWSSGDVNASEGQLLLYHELVQRFADKPVRLQFAVITKSKEPVIELQTVNPDPQRIERVRRLIKNVWTGIQLQNFYPVPSAMNCPTCGYRDRCSRWNG